MYVRCYLPCACRVHAACMHCLCGARAVHMRCTCTCTRTCTCGVHVNADEYAALKRERAKPLWAAVEKLIPDIRDRLEVEMVRPPRVLGAHQPCMCMHMLHAHAHAHVPCCQ